MSVREIRDYVGESKRLAIAGHVLQKRCAGMEPKLGGAEAADLVRRLAEGAPNDGDRARWDWALNGIRDDELRLLMGWGGVCPELLAQARCAMRSPEAVMKETERLIHIAEDITLHGPIVCPTRKDLGPKAIEAVKALDRKTRNEGEMVWLPVGAKGEIGIPWTTVEQIQACSRKRARRHTRVRRQHHIPVWLSSGFADPQGRSGRIHVYTREERNDNPYMRTPDGWGVRKGFYDEEERSADPLLDEWDQRDARTMGQLRREGCKDRSVVERIPGLLTRLVIRRATTRMMIEEQTESLQQGWCLLARNECVAGESRKERIVRRLQNGAKGIREVVEEELRILEVPENELDEKIAQWMTRAAEQAKRLDKGVFEEAEHMAPEHFALQARAMGRAWHNEWLCTELGMDEGLDKYHKDMAYCVMQCSEPMLILGDSVVVESREGYAVPHDPLQEPDRPLEAVYLPIRSDLLLVGKRNGREPRELGWIFAACARLSHESFISEPGENRYAEAERNRIGECREGVNLAKGYAMALECREARDT